MDFVRRGWPGATHCLRQRRQSVAYAGETVRQKELAIRTALGARRGRIVRQLLIESMLLAGSGGALGLLLASWGVRALALLGPANLPRAAEINVDGRVLAFTLLLAALTGLVFGSRPRGKPRTPICSIH